MNTGNLIAHAEGNRLVSDADLAALPLPAKLGRHHKPVPHVDLVTAIHEEIARRGLTIESEWLSVAQKDAAIFGVINLGGLVGLS